MKTPNTNLLYTDDSRNYIGSHFFKRLWEHSWTYIKTMVDVVREPVLILDENFCVIAANEPFYTMFKVEQKDTENKLIYKLGNGQWDIPGLRKLFEDILPKKTFFKGFEVTHEFPNIGKKVMILNARQIYFEEHSNSELFLPIILLAIEDITELMGVAEMLARHTTELETTMADRTEKLEIHIKKLVKQIEELEKK